MIDYTTYMSNMLDSEQLIKKLTILPKYEPSITNCSCPERLLALSDVYKIYIPSRMTFEIYNKIYLALYKSLEKKGTISAVKQRYENYKIIRKQPYSGILGGSDSFTIIGPSGIGKSSTIDKVISVITQEKIISDPKNNIKIIPCLVVQCPFDSSVKGLLFEIMRKVDEYLNTNFYECVTKSKNISVDILIGMVSNIAINHIGILIVDEIQNIVKSKNGMNLVGAITQLINNSGISICMVGTPECEQLFEKEMYLARRSIGLYYNKLDYDNFFKTFCDTLFQYQYVKNKIVLTDELTGWLYQHTNGIIALIISLMHDAQEIAILDGSEIINVTTLNDAYQKRLLFIHNYMSQKKVNYTAIKIKKENYNTTKSSDKFLSFKEIVEQANKQNKNVISLLKAYFTVTEVEI